ncbi:poly-gamma-glutamate hydrolase family protein, partial [Bacillus pumilus]|uniref:poly-gamma-glutamate hydrolase family protein n=1 Tax=Bacillus pumilus TaxID=1408 RepID=UPI003704B992
MHYQILHHRKPDHLLLLSPHPPRIQSPLTHLIHQISTHYSIYLFQPLKLKANHLLHITTTPFDDPISLS